MRIRTVSLIAAITLGGVTVLGAAPAHAEKFESPDTVWIYGKDYSLTTDGCAAASLKPVLQVKRDGKWVTIAKGRRYKAKACSDLPDFPYRHKFQFTLEDLGTPVPGERYSQLEVRRYWKAYGKPISRPFVKMVLPSEQAHRDWLLEGFLESLTD